MVVQQAAPVQEETIVELSQGEWEAQDRHEVQPRYIVYTCQCTCDNNITNSAPTMWYVTNSAPTMWYDGAYSGYDVCRPHTYGTLLGVILLHASLY